MIGITFKDLPSRFWKFELVLISKPSRCVRKRLYNHFWHMVKPISKVACLDNSVTFAFSEPWPVSLARTPHFCRQETKFIRDVPLRVPHLNDFVVSFDLCLIDGGLPCDLFSIELVISSIIQVQQYYLWARDIIYPTVSKFLCSKVAEQISAFETKSCFEVR